MTAGKNFKIGLLAVVVALLVGLFIAKPIIEKNVEQRAEEDLSLFEPWIAMKAEKIEAALFSRSLVYKNLEISVPLIGFTMQVEDYKYSGIDFMTFLGRPGDLTVIAKVEMLNVVNRLDPMVLVGLFYGLGSEVGSSQVFDTGKVEKYVLDGLSYNYRDLRKIMLENKDKDILEYGLKLLPLLNTVHADRARQYKISSFMKDLAPASSSVGYSIDYAESNDISINKMGPMLVRDMNVSVDGQIIAHLGEAGANGFKMPGIVREALDSPGSILATFLSRQADYEKNPFLVFEGFELDNLYFNDLEITVPGIAPLKLENWSMSLSVNKVFGLASAMKNLFISKELLAGWGGMQELLDEPLSLSGDFRFEMDPTAKMMPVHISGGLADATLGGGKGSMDISLPGGELARFYDADFEETWLKGFMVQIHDKGIIPLFITFYARLSGGGCTAEDIYDEIALFLEDAFEDSTHPLEAKFIESVKSMLEQGGKFTLSFSPAEPVKMGEFTGYDRQDIFDALGLKVEYSPD